MPIKPQHVAQLTVLLSPDRLASLTELTGSAETAIELHQATLQLGSRMMHVTATIEIALRNTVADNLSRYFGVPNWLQQPPIAFRWKEPERKKIEGAVDSAKRAEYAKLSQAQKAQLDAIAYPRGRPPNTPHLRRAKERRRQITVTEGKVIAELTLYFWKRLYGPEYDHLLWRTTLKRTFPDKSLTRAAIAIQLEQLYQTRNRLAHHEPVLHQRFSDTMTAIDFIVQRLGTTSPSPETPLATLLADDIYEVRAQEEALSARLRAFRM
ncbi:hypothetical protein [Afifella sp. YEN Y35]|uniref:hypothetical protein n=1 Tax=Afifella sp. YEN Y35 TaxID=3388337 RepID=UPI0039DFD6ED